MKKFFVPLAILLLVALVISGCGTAATTTVSPTATTATVKPTATTTAPITTTSVKPTVTAPPITTSATPSKYGGTLRFATNSVPGTPIGWMQETIGGSTVTMQLVMDFLLHERVDGTLDPNLAESYEVNPDPKAPSVTFKLRKGVKYGDGSDFNAQTVKWCLETTGKGPANAGQAAFWKSFDVIDDYTLKVNFTTWQNRLIRGFADASTYLYSKEAFDKNGLEWIRWHMVGPGPFKQADFQRDVVTKTVKNEFYWDKGKPYLDGVDLIYVLDELTRVALFKSRGADIMDTAGNGRIANELKADGAQIISKVGGVTLLAPDSANADSPWSNLKVRMAAEYAIDKEALVGAFGYGYWQSAYQLPSPSTKAYDPAFTGRKFDLAKAKQLLTEAGYPSGFKTTLIVQTGGNSNIPLTIQANLAKVNIQAAIEFQDAAKYTATAQSVWKNGIILNTLIEWPNYNNGFNFYFGTTSPWFKATKKPDGWSDAFTATMTAPTADVALMRKAANLLYDDATVITINYGANIWAAQPNVRDVGYEKRSSIYWNNQETWFAK